MRRFVLGEFSAPEPMVAAARKLRESGRQGLDAHSPYPVHGIDEALALPRSKVPLVALIGGVSGAVLGYVLQWWTNAVDFSINVGNRPPHSWPTNIPITFETGVLICALSTFFASIGYFFGLPRLYHPVFEAEEFRTAALDAFWISAEAKDAEDAADLEGELRRLGARKVRTVEEAR